MNFITCICILFLAAPFAQIRLHHIMIELKFTCSFNNCDYFINLYTVISIFVNFSNKDLIALIYYSGDFRPVIHYRDLDAPREPDEFL